MRGHSDASLIGQWKGGCRFLWRIFFVCFGFWLVIVLAGSVLGLPFFDKPLGKVLRVIAWVLLLVGGLPLLAYWAKRWWEVSR